MTVWRLEGDTIFEWTFSNSPRHWNDTDYYTAGNTTVAAICQQGANWLDTSSADDAHPGDYVAYVSIGGWETWENLHIYLVDDGAGNKSTIYSNVLWASGLETHLVDDLEYADIELDFSVENAIEWDNTDQAFTDTSSLAVCADSMAGTKFKTPPEMRAVYIPAFVADSVAGSVAIDKLEIGTQFQPVRVAQIEEPSLGVGECVVWFDTDAEETWLIYHDLVGGQVKVQLTSGA